jgi:hypothetical protein
MSYNIHITDDQCHNCEEKPSYKIFIDSEIAELEFNLCFECLDNMYIEARNLLIKEFKRTLFSATEDLYNEMENIIGE